jgi:8-oxo-dGTP diphosphatase
MLVTHDASVDRKIIVAAALLNEKAQVLVQRRPQGKDMAGLWEFPGGKVERNERLEEALSRELLEELDITTDTSAFEPACFNSVPIAGGSMLLLLYVCRTWVGEPKPLHADAILWRTPQELLHLAMPPADIPFIAYLETRL